MEFIGLLILLLVVLFIVVITAPILLYCDTQERRYYMKLKGILRAEISEQTGTYYLTVHSFLIKKKIKLNHLMSLKKNKAQAKKKSFRRRTKRSAGAILRFMREVFKTFRVRRFLLNIDLDDYVINAQLYPLLRWISHDNIQWRVNFQGDTKLHFLIENKLFRLIPPAWKLIMAK